MARLNLPPPSLRTGRGFVAAILLATGAFGQPARGEPRDAPGGNRASAAAAFDEGVTRFDHADYVAAARAFLMADDLSPSADALTNAISAARRGNDHLVVVKAAERAKIGRAHV